MIQASYKNDNWVLKLIIANVVFYLMQNSIPYFTGIFALTPILVTQEGYIWQFVTYMFLHSPVSLIHILFNMYALYLFGSAVEQVWGSKKFLLYYFFTGIGAGISIFIVNNFIYDLQYVPTLGASGAVFGMLLAFGILFPDVELLFFFVLPVKAKYMVMIYGGLELFLQISSGGQGTISHIGHLGGLLFGIIFFLVDKKHSFKSKTKIFAEQIMSEFKNVKTETQAIPKVDDNITFLKELLEKVSKKGKDLITDDEFQHFRYLMIMHDGEECIYPESEICLLKEIDEVLTK